MSNSITLLSLRYIVDFSRYRESTSALNSAVNQRAIAATARIVFDAVIQLRRPTNSLIRRFIPAFSRRSFAPQQRNYSAHYPSRFTGVEFAQAFVSFSTKPEITLRHPLPTRYNSISPFDFSSLFLCSCPSVCTRFLQRNASTQTPVLSLPSRWIHEVKA